MDKIISWLTDEMSTGTAAPGTTPERFHFYIPWLVFCLLGLLAWFYYTREGRRRFFGRHTLHKALLDRFMPHLAVLATVGLLLLGARYAGVSVFAWRLWRYAWALWAVAFFGYWAYYLATKYRAHLAAYNWQRTHERYLPQPNPKRQRTARVS
ncbi:MAG: hypothetical protein IVW57_18600 [Ktedonobacterales bacterium]|nr:hypothetical protein [Ktedonobacterales bacterium]